MPIIVPGATCACGKVVGPASPVYGWQQDSFMCRHTTTYQCPECYEKMMSKPHEERDYPTCPVCGTDGVLT